MVRQTQGGLERRNILLVDSWRLNRLVAAKVLSQVLPLKIRHPLFDGFLAPKIMEKEHLKIRKPLILLDLSVLSQLYPMGIRSRRTRAPERRGHQDGERNAWPLRRRIHAAHLHARDGPDAGAGGGNDGKPDVAGDVSGTAPKDADRESRRRPLLSKRCFSLKIPVWVGCGS